MDHNAHTILRGVIASHGEQLTISTAFCKVYLTGYLADYPNEKTLLITLKHLELPAALSAYVNAEMTETALFDCIEQLAAHWEGKPDELAWGVDAWAAAIGVNAAIRCKIREHCFPIMPLSPSVTIESPAPVNTPRSRLGFGARLTTNVAGVFGLMMLQVFGSNSPSSSIIPPMPHIPQAVATIAPKTEPVLPKVERTDSVRLEVIPVAMPTIAAIDIPRLNAIVEIEHMAQADVIQIDRPASVSQPLNPEDYDLKLQRLLAETESFLQYGNQTR
jgi:hypothetical protein